MRLVLALAALGSLAACALPPQEPTLELRSPLWPRNRSVEPTLAPSGWAIPTAQVPAYQAVPQYAAPAPSACAPAAPAYTPGFQYAAPPAPGSPCR